MCILVSLDPQFLGIPRISVLGIPGCCCFAVSLSCDINYDMVHSCFSFTRCFVRLVLDMALAMGGWHRWWAPLCLSLVTLIVPCIHEVGGPARPTQCTAGAADTTNRMEAAALFQMFLTWVRMRKLCVGEQVRVSLVDLV